MKIPLPAKLMASYLLVAGLIALPAALFLKGSLVHALQESEAHELESRALSLRARISTVPAEQLDSELRQLAPLLALRLTYIDPSGRVLVDTEVPAERVGAMENHLQRPEVQAALHGKVGVDTRSSQTLGRPFVYVAIPVPGEGEPQGVLRLASPGTHLSDAAESAFLGIRVTTGVGISAAILMSLVAALFITRPLRRMRDAALAFSQARWVEVEKLHSGDELEELSDALVELGAKLRGQLVQVGAQEALLTQALDAMPMPCVLLGEDLHPMHVNGALRTNLNVTAAREEARVKALAGDMRVIAAQAEAAEKGEPVELRLDAAQLPDGARLGALLVPLARPSAQPWWLLVLDLDEDAEERGAEAVQRLLVRAERVVERLWQGTPDHRPALAQLLLTLDDIGLAVGHPSASGIEPMEASALVARCVDEVVALEPEGASRLNLEESPHVRIAESAGLLGRAVRRLLRQSLLALPRGRSLEVGMVTEATCVKLTVEGAAPADMEPVQALARALGADAGRVPAREKEAAWLNLPRA